MKEFTDLEGGQITAPEGPHLLTHMPHL